MVLMLEELLRGLVEHGASDLHLKANACPAFRINGKLKPQERFGVQTADDTRRLAYEILSVEQVQSFEAEGDLDCSHAIPDCARFRVNVLTQRGSVGANNDPSLVRTEN